MKRKRLTYRSNSTDDINIVCNSIEEAINCFRADCEAMLSDDSDDPEIELSVVKMTDEEVAAIPDC